MRWYLASETMTAPAHERAKRVGEGFQQRRQVERVDGSSSEAGLLARAGPRP